MKTITLRMLHGLGVALLATAMSAAGAQTDARQAIEVSALGPQVGEQVPDFNLPDQFGNYHSLEDVMGPNGAMLLFHRSADW